VVQWRADPMRTGTSFRMVLLGDRSRVTWTQREGGEVGREGRGVVEDNRRGAAK
jgi:hypothetical protein